MPQEVYLFLFYYLSNLQEVNHLYINRVQWILSISEGIFLYDIEKVTSGWIQHHLLPFLSYFLSYLEVLNKLLFLTEVLATRPFDFIGYKWNAIYKPLHLFF